MSKGNARLNKCLTGQEILVVEDEYLILLDLQLILEDAGASVVTAASVADGLAHVDDRFTAAVLDVRLGDGDVFPVAEALQGRQVPLLFHSGHADRTRLSEMFPDAVALSKPASEDRLVAAVSRLASKAERRLS